jgi:hypothetical protein
MTEEYRKCVVTKGMGSKLDPCDGLLELVAPSYRGLGVGHSQRVNMETSERTRETWFIRSGKHSKNGLHMNFCPVCGEELRGLFEHMFVVVDRAEPADPTP